MSTINAGGRLIDLAQPKIMAILNITPDSFYADSRISSIGEALKKTEHFLSEGADLIDIGAYSSRSGAAALSEQEETARLLPIVRALVQEFPEAILSIDTFRASTARQAVESGAHIINDISGGSLDQTMFETVAAMGVPYILMHMRGTPDTMQRLTDYDDVVQDVSLFFGTQLATLQEMGVKDIILDPGFGFAKTLEQNYILLSRLQELQRFGRPVLGAISRKSMIYKALDTSPEDALNGTTVLNTHLLMKGASILRVHDVAAAREVIQLTARITEPRFPNPPL